VVLGIMTHRTTYVGRDARCEGGVSTAS
jgi:hypothetical protein